MTLDENNAGFQEEEAYDESQAPETKQQDETQEPAPVEDLEGLKRNRDEILAEKKAYQERARAAEARSDAAERKLQQIQDAANPPKKQEQETEVSKSLADKVDVLDSKYEALDKRFQNDEITSAEYWTEKEKLDKDQRKLMKEIASQPEQEKALTAEQQLDSKVHSGVSELSQLVPNLLFVPTSFEEWTSICQDEKHPNHKAAVNAAVIFNTAKQQKISVEAAFRMKASDAQLEALLAAKKANPKAKPPEKAVEPKQPEPKSNREATVYRREDKPNSTQGKSYRDVVAEQAARFD